MFTACQSGNVEQDESWRKFFMSEASLSVGYVKKTSVKNNKDSLVYYDKVFLEEGKIILDRFDSDFKIVREDINSYDSVRMILIDATYYYDGIGAVKAKIIEPTIAPYKPTEKTLRTHLEIHPEEDIVISSIAEANYIGNEVYNFNGKDVECIKFSYNEEYRITNEDAPEDNISHKSKGFTLWGENIGLVYMEFEDNRGTTEFKVDDILSIEEFEKLKL